MHNSVKTYINIIYNSIVLFGFLHVSIAFALTTVHVEGREGSSFTYKNNKQVAARYRIMSTDNQSYTGMTVREHNVGSGGLATEYFQTVKAAIATRTTGVHASSSNHFIAETSKFVTQDGIMATSVGFGLDECLETYDIVPRDAACSEDISIARKAPFGVSQDTFTSCSTECTASFIFFWKIRFGVPGTLRDFTGCRFIVENSGLSSGAYAEALPTVSQDSQKRSLGNSVIVALCHSVETCTCGPIATEQVVVGGHEISPYQATGTKTSTCQVHSIHRLSGGARSTILDQFGEPSHCKLGSINKMDKNQRVDPVWAHARSARSDMGFGLSLAVIDISSSARVNSASHCLVVTSQVVGQEGIIWSSLGREHEGHLEPALRDEMYDFAVRGAACSRVIPIARKLPFVSPEDPLPPSSTESAGSIICSLKGELVIPGVGECHARWGSSGEFDPGPLNAPPNIVTCSADWVENEGLVRQVESMESPCTVSFSTSYNSGVFEDTSEKFESTIPTATTASGETPKAPLA